MAAAVIGRQFAVWCSAGQPVKFRHMYTSCLFCSAGLGSNGEVEHLPVGRRLAFDAHRGRIWTVCPRCGRWNLVPFEERLEALDECGRLAERSLVRESGEELTLLKHPSGLSLIRVGRPTLAELVSWRFARSMVWRRRGYVVSLSAATGLAVGVLAGVATGGIVFGAVQTVLLGKAYRDMLWPAIRMETADGRSIRVTAMAARGATFGRGDDGEPFLDVDFRRPQRLGRPPHRFTGADIGSFIAVAMPYVNEEGASERLAVEAAAAIEERGGRERFLDAVSTDRELLEQARFRNLGTKRTGVLLRLPRPIRLAMEAASHVEQEERALSGELRSAFAEWRRAEQIASISDSLLDPPGWDDFRGSARPRE